MTALILSKTGLIMAALIVIFSLFIIDLSSSKTPSATEIAASESAKHIEIDTPSASEIIETKNNGGGKKRIPYCFDMNISCDPNIVKRGTYINISYKLNVLQKGNSPFDIKISIPNDFKYIKIYKNKIKSGVSIRFDKDIPQISVDGTLDQNESLEIGYSALIPLDAKLNEYNISSMINCFTVNNESKYIKVLNNPPNITKFEFLGLQDQGNDTYSCFNESRIYLFYCVDDRENNNVIINISVNESQIISTRNLTGRIPYDAVESKTFEFNISAIDNDGDPRYKIKYLNVKNETFQENFLKEFPYIMSSILILQFLLIFLFRSLNIKINNQNSIWNKIKIFFIIITILFVLLAGNIRLDFLDYIFCLYLIISLFCIIFFELNFAPIRANDSLLTFYIISGMMVATLIVGYSLPLSFLKINENTIYSYIFYYYSAIIQLFGTVLSIVAMITVHNLQRNKMAKFKPEVAAKLKNFMFLYISVIIISLGGLALGKIPPLDVSLKITSITISGTIFCFVATMLLIIPAFAALFSLTCWLMDLDSREDAVQEFSFH